MILKYFFKVPQPQTFIMMCVGDTLNSQYAGFSNIDLSAGIEIKFNSASPGPLSIASTFHLMSVLSNIRP